MKYTPEEFAKEKQRRRNKAWMKKYREQNPKFDKEYQHKQYLKRKSNGYYEPRKSISL